jgi:hypothetical protein
MVPQHPAVHNLQQPHREAHLQRTTKPRLRWDNHSPAETSIAAASENSLLFHVQRIISFLDELLIRATQRALLSCMELLFNAGANASLRIPLVCIGLVSLAQIDQQSWVAIREDAGETRHEKKLAVLRLLLAYNAATELTSVIHTYDETYNNTLLAYAIRNGWVDIAELLLQHGAAYPSEIHNEYAPLEPLRYCAWKA